MTTIKSKKFAQKPIIIEAVQIKRLTRIEIFDFGGQSYLSTEHDPFPEWVGTLCKKCGHNIYGHSELRKKPDDWDERRTIRGVPMVICPKSWLIIDANGDLDTVSDEAFQLSYEPVED
jgi:hypothetical protein